MPTVWITKKHLTTDQRNMHGEEWECAHFSCVDYGRDLAEFLGYEIKEMADESYQWIKNILV